MFTDRMRCFGGRLLSERGMVLSLRPRGSEKSKISSTRLKVLTNTSGVRKALFKGNREANGMSVVALTVGVFSRKIGPRLSFSGVDSVYRICRHMAEVGISPHRPCTKSLMFATFSNSRRSTVTGNVA